MMTAQTAYRPQWLYPTPKGYREEQFHYFFSATNCAGLATAIAAGALRENIPLVLEAGSEFCWRAYSVQPFYNPESFWMRFKDPFGNYLSSAYVSMGLYSAVSGMAWTTLGARSRIVIPLEPEVICPPSSCISLDLKNLATAVAQTLSNVSLTLYGLKRVPE